MLTFNGRKMAKSEGTGVTPKQMLTGDHDLLTQAYDAMTIRFFMLQAHYRSTLDFSNEALQAAEKGLKRLLIAIDDLNNLSASDSSSLNVAEMREKLYGAMNDDFNSPIAIAHLFEVVKWVNLIKEGKESLTSEDLDTLKSIVNHFVFDIFGLKDEQGGGDDNKVEDLMQFILEIRQDAKAEKNYNLSDQIRDRLNDIGFTIKDGKEGTTYTVS